MSNIFSILFLFLSVIILLWNLAITFLIFKIKRKQEILFKGKKITNLEEIVLTINQKETKLEEETKDLYQITNKIHSLASSSFYKLGLVRFNPFKEIGGDQSFALALLNGKNDGFVISSLYLKEGTRLYAKPIKNGQTEKYPLSEEEKKAIFLAIDSIKR